MSDLALVSTFLSCQMIDQPRLVLACAAAWLDPLHFMGQEFEDILYDGDEYSAARIALVIARQSLPELYPQLVAQVRQDASTASVVGAFCAFIKQKYPFIPAEEFVDRLDCSYGIPLVLLGFDPTEPAFITNFPEWKFVLDDLGMIAAELDENHWQYSHEARFVYPPGEIAWVSEHIANPLVGSLISAIHAGAGQPYADLAFLLMRIFCATGSDLLDMTEDDFWEAGFEPPGWNKEELEYTNHAYAEVQMILQSAQRGLERLRMDKKLRAAFRRNIKYLKNLKKGEAPNYDRIHWSCGNSEHGAENGPERRTASDLTVLYLRNHYAPPRR